jgi:hypothetical protein
LSPTPRCAALVACLCGSLLAGCGGAGKQPAATTNATPSIPLATFTCAQWRVSPESVRSVIIAELHDFYGGPVSGKRRTKAYGTVLSDKRATQLFDSYCRQSFARGFTIYKLYARATAFTGQAP